MISIDDALQRVLQVADRLPAVEVSLADATGLVLADDVVATEPVPPFANSAVDGYAVRVADVAGASPTHPVDLPVVGELAAGSAPDVEVAAGTAVRIMTGAPIPPGAEAVVMVEHTSRVGDDHVRITSGVALGDAVRHVGEDVHAGQFVVGAGTVIRPALAGVLASVNLRRPRVIPTARVAVLSTGDELVDDGSPLRPGQIRESNRTMLLGLVTATGAQAIDFGIVGDDEAALEGVLADAAATCDAIVTSGGVSMGDYDVVKAVLGRMATMSWMQIAIKPAKPFALGTVVHDGRRVPIFGLPGNPVSSLVSFELLARPALRRIMGYPPPWGRPEVTALADGPLRRRPDGKTHYQRVQAAFGDDGLVHVRSVGAQGSHQLAATAMANALAVVPDGDGVAEGARVQVLLLDVVT
jgi:molybdenum cofactor synthesis domain-containing protein